MELEFDDIVRSGLAKQVSETIRSAILEGRLRVDDRLPSEEELARRFQVSRPTVREALKRLAAQSLIRSRRGPAGGNFIARPDLDGVSKVFTGAATLLVGLGAFDADEMIDARIETETICCRLAAANRQPADLQAMAAEIEIQRDEALSDEEFCASDVRFHRALVTASRNGPIRLMMYTVLESFIPITNMLIYRMRERRRAADAHERVMRAIETGDGLAAEAVMRLHLEGMRADLASAVEQRNATAGKGDVA